MIGLAVRGAEHALGIGRDQGAPREDAEVDGLEMAEQGVVALDRHHRLPGLDRVAVVEREDLEPVPVVGAELEHRDRLVHAAEHGGVALEDLHHDARVAAVGEQRRAGVVEVRVGVVALPHLLDGKVEHVRVEPLAAHLEAWCHAGSSASRQAVSAASATSSWAADGSAVEMRVCRMWPGRARARESGCSGWRSIQPKISTAALIAPTAPSALAAGRAEAGARAASALAAALVSEQRADEMAAAAVVLLRCRLARLVGADRDVLGSVVRGEVAAPERDHGRGQRGKGGDGFLREEPELRAPSDARRCRSGDDRNGDAWPLEREARLGEGAAHVGEHRERLGEPQRAADERRRHVRREPPLDAGGRADRAVGCANRGAPRGRTVHEDPVRESHAAEPQLVHAVRVPCCDGLPSGARTHRGRAAGRRG